MNFSDDFNPEYLTVNTMSIKKPLDVKKIIERAKTALGIKTDIELAKILNVKQQTISTWKGRNKIDLEKIITTCDFISSEWLLYGKGSMEGGLDVDDTTKKLLLILEGLDDEQKRDILRYAQKEELLSELIRERKAG